MNKDICIVNTNSAKQKSMNKDICIVNTNAAKHSAKAYYESFTEEEKDALYMLLWNRQMHKTCGKIYGVEQSCNGHSYRWIFDEKTLKIQNIDLSNVKRGFREDIGFPIGGSNSSATWIVELNELEEAQEFLLVEDYTEYEDPMLVDIAEGICSIGTGVGSITEQYVEMLQIPEELMTRENGYFTEVNNMIHDLSEQGVDCELDYENPFYGTSKEMRLSRLRELYESYIENNSCQKRKEK